MDTLLRITIRPLGPKITADSGGTCHAWQASHPGTSPWIIVNSKAVPACEHTDSATKVLTISLWQYCAFYEKKDGSKGKTINSWNNPYCEEQFQSWINESSG